MPAPVTPAAGRRAVAATLILALAWSLTGCTAAPAAPPAPKEVQITLAGGKAEPNGQRIDLVRGQELVLNITADHEDKVHVHGFDLEIAVSAGRPVTQRVVMDRVGRYEVESHDPVFTLLVLQIQ